MALTTGALTTVAQVKALATDKDIIPAGHDALIEFLIEAMSDRIEQYLGRTLERKAYVENYVGHGRQYLLLKQWPIVSVTYIKDGGSTVAAADYTVLSEEGMVFKESGWTGGALELKALALGEVHPNAVKFNLEVSYTSGYVTPNMAGTRNLPYDIELACARLVWGMYKRRDKEGIARESAEGLSVDFDRWPADIVAILDQYRRVG